MTKWILVFACVTTACQSAPRATAPAPSPQLVELTARRAQMIEWLREYYERGVYPTDAEGKPISVFQDAHGVRCPMAELIYRSGHADLVRRARGELRDRILDAGRCDPFEAVHAFLPSRASRSAARIFAGVIGSSVIRTPMAL